MPTIKRVVIYSPTFKVVQSGTRRLQVWKIRSDNPFVKWKDHFLGWTSSHYSIALLEFHLLEDAIAYCQSCELDYEVHPPKRRRFIKKYC